MLRFSSQINGTPFSLCVVIPQRSRLQQLRMGSFPTPVNANYHRLDVLAAEDQLCQHISQTTTEGQHSDTSIDRKVLHTIPSWKPFWWSGSYALDIPYACPSVEVLEKDGHSWT